MRTHLSPILATATPAEIEALRGFARRVYKPMHPAKRHPDDTQGTQPRAVAFVDYYVHAARLVGVDPVLALVQTWLETTAWSSWWAASPRRNLAGIGVNGDRIEGVKGNPPPVYVLDKTGTGYVRGYSFGTYRFAADCHVRMLAQMAGADTAPLDAKLGHAKPVNAAAHTHGKCHSWNDLCIPLNPKKAGWATDPGYADKLARSAQALARTYRPAR